MVSTNYEDVKKRWNEYFERLLNKDYPREVLESISWNKGLIGLVSIRSKGLGEGDEKEKKW